MWDQLFDTEPANYPRSGDMQTPNVLRFLKSAVGCWRPSILACFFHGYAAVWWACCQAAAQRSCWIIHVWRRAAEKVRLYKAKLIKVAVLKVCRCLIQEERKERSAVILFFFPSVSLSLVPRPPSSSHFTYPPLPSAFSGKLQPDCSL